MTVLNPRHGSPAATPSGRETIPPATDGAMDRYKT